MESGNPDSERQGEQEQRDADLPGGEPDEPVVAQPERAATQEQSQGGSRPAPTLARLWGRVQWLTVLQVIGLLAAGGNVLVAYWQFQAIKKTNEIAERALEETRKTNAESDASTRRSLELAENTLRETARANKETAELTRQSLESTEQSNQRAQRAWITVKGFSFTDPSREAPVALLRLVPGVGVPVWARIENMGHSPAIDVTVVMWWTYTDKPERNFFSPEPPYPGAYGVPRSRTVMVQGVQQWIRTVVGPLDETKIKEINAGTLRLYIYGRINYADSFHRERQTTFCARLTRLGTMDFCEFYNTMR